MHGLTRNANLWLCLTLGALAATCAAGGDYAPAGAAAAGASAAGASAGGVAGAVQRHVEVILPDAAARDANSSEPTAPSADASADSANASADSAPAMTCDQCAATRVEQCADQYAACEQDAQCARVLGCAYDPPGCSLDGRGVACVLSCIEQECTAASSIALFLQAEHCAFCTEACAAQCSAYCPGLSGLEPSSASCAAGAGGSAP
jgi:hypothetical protein